MTSAHHPLSTDAVTPPQKATLYSSALLPAALYNSALLPAAVSHFQFSAPRSSASVTVLSSYRRQGKNSLWTVEYKSFIINYKANWRINIIILTYYVVRRITKPRCKQRAQLIILKVAWSNASSFQKKSIWIKMDNLFWKKAAPTARKEEGSHEMWQALHQGSWSRRADQDLASPKQTKQQPLPSLSWH